MLRCFSYFILIALLLVPMASVAARGNLMGSAELRYAGQSREEDGTKTLEASHFVQQYSFLWDKKGELGGGRLGEYDVALGYEWSAVDSEINHQTVEIDNPLDKILYRGDIKIAPGGLPFRLHAFSYDMHQTQFVSTDLGTLFGSQRRDSVDRGIITDIHNGTQVTSGITLEAGVTNGHYQGQYRDLLATLPRLLIDYRQVVVHDVRGPNPRDYVDRDLAFVSLNKKNNWFHYRRFEHTDKIDLQQNMSEDTILLGTVDHTNRRQWVDLTNWIKVSSDISYNKVIENRGLGDTQRYDVNLFFKATRSRWQMDNFTSYSRVRTDDDLEQSLAIPFYARGELNRDTSWRFQLEGSKIRNQRFSLADKNRESVYLRGQVDTFRQGRFILRPQVELETKSASADEGEGQSARLGIELFSNSRYRSAGSFLVGYSVLYASGRGEQIADVSSLEQTLRLSIDSPLNNRVRLGMEEELVYSLGRYDNSVSDRISGDSSTSAFYTDPNTHPADDKLLISRSLLFSEFTEPSGLKNRFELSYELLEAEHTSSNQLGLTHRLDYGTDALYVVWTNRYTDGSNLPSSFAVSGGDSATNDNLMANNNFSYSLMSKLRFRYTQGRASMFDFDAEYEGFHYQDGSDVERVNLRQNYEYSFWTMRGRIRKLVVLGETVEYQKTASGASNPQGLQTYSVYTNYYPTTISLLSARLSYEQDELADTETLLTFLSAGVEFAKLQASVDYSYGHRPQTSTNPDILEHKWEVKVKKTF